MALATAIGVGLAAGKLGVSAMLHYTKKQYEEKITELEGYNTKLEQHLAELEGLKSQIPEFWEDDEGEKALKIIDKSIFQVKSASDRVMNLRILYKGVVDEMDQQKSMASGLLDEAQSLVSNLAIKG